MRGRAVNGLILKCIAAFGDNGRNDCLPIREKAWEGALKSTQIPGNLVQHLVGRDVPNLKEVAQVLGQEPDCGLYVPTEGYSAGGAHKFELFLRDSSRQRHGPQGNRGAITPWPYREVRLLAVWGAIGTSRYARCGQLSNPAPVSIHAEEARLPSPFGNGNEQDMAIRTSIYERTGIQIAGIDGLQGSRGAI